MGRGQTLILILLTLMVVLLIGIAAYIVIQSQVWKRSQFQSKNTRRWIGGPNAHWKRMGSPDPYQQLLLQQQMLLTQLRQQSQAETQDDDPPQLPTGWWG